jgi:hypothetical protein
VSRARDVSYFQLYISARTQSPRLRVANFFGRVLLGARRIPTSAKIRKTTMKFKRVLAVVPASMLLFGNGVALTGEAKSDAGALACVTDKWDEKEPEKGHKLVDFAGRCVDIPNDPASPKFAEDCVGNYEYMPDGSWKATGSCTRTEKGEDKMYTTWEEGSQLKEYPYKVTGGTGKYQGASGSGTYFYENLTDTLSGGTYKGQLVLP